MAIQTNLSESQFGVPFTGAYFRIVTAAVSRQRNPELRHTVMIAVAGYATQPQTEDTREVDFRRYHAPYLEVELQAGDTFLAKCYAWVMQQPDMQGALSA